MKLLKSIIIFKHQSKPENKYIQSMEESSKLQEDLQTLNSLKSEPETPFREERPNYMENLEKLRRGKPKNYLNVLSYFRLFFNDEILDLFVEESNHYFTEILKEKYGNDFKNIVLSMNKEKLAKNYAYYYVTRGISKEDILTFIGIKIFMGLHKYPSLKSYWSSNYMCKINFNKAMPITYYFLIEKALHFPEKDCNEEKESSSFSSDKDNSETLSNNGIKDPRHKIKLYLEKLAKNFQNNYELGENITIDECLVHFKGRNSMKFYIPMKPHKWGFKIHLLCDSDSHYLYNMLFDPGKAGKSFIWNENTSSLSEAIVLKLLEPLDNKKKRNVFFDGWYSSLSLMKKLSKMGYLNTTVLRASSKELPAKIKTEGYNKAYNEELLIQKYEGKKTIYFATNYKIDIEELRNIYNIKNRAVDTFDAYLQISSIQRRTLKWYKKIFVFGIDAAIINSKILFELKTGKPITTVKFKENLVDEIFNLNKRRKNIENNFNENIRPNPNPNSKVISSNAIRNTMRDDNCIICGKLTSFTCHECDSFMHYECFEKYHGHNSSGCFNTIPAKTKQINSFNNQINKNNNDNDTASFISDMKSVNGDIKSMMDLMNLDDNKTINNDEKTSTNNEEKTNINDNSDKLNNNNDKNSNEEKVDNKNNEEKINDNIDEKGQNKEEENKNNEK